MNKGVVAVALLLGMFGFSSSVSAVERGHSVVPQVEGSVNSMSGTLLLAATDGPEVMDQASGVDTPVKPAKVAKKKSNKSKAAQDKKKAKKAKKDKKAKKVKQKKDEANQESGTGEVMPQQ